MHPSQMFHSAISAHKMINLRASSQPCWLKWQSQAPTNRPIFISTSACSVLISQSQVLTWNKLLSFFCPCGLFVHMQITGMFLILGGGGHLLVQTASLQKTRAGNVNNCSLIWATMSRDWMLEKLLVLMLHRYLADNQQTFVFVLLYFSQTDYFS